MFNPHIHQQQQQQQQQQFHQHLRQLQQLFQQQPPPPPPQPPPGHHVAHHHHQTPRAIPVPPQTAPPPRMVNLCQTTQTTLIAPNPMLQGALLMQQMQGNMRNFGMGGQQFRQFFTAGARSSLLGPVPMGMAIKSPIMGFPAARAFHPHARYYNNSNTATATTTTTTIAPSTSSSSSSSTTTDTTARQPDRKRDSEQMATGSTDNQPTASSTNEPDDKSETDGAVGGVDGPTQILEEQLEEPAVKKQRTEESESIIIPDTDGEVLSSECNSNTESHPEDAIILEEGGSTGESDVIEALEESRADEVHSCLSAPSLSGRLSEDDQQVSLLPEETPQGKDASLDSPGNQDEGDEGVAEGATKFYCYLCSITCHNQQNFRSHMNSISHQQRMMEIQHMSNACLVTLLPRVQESLQGANKDGEKKADVQCWCATCHTHFTSSIMDHRRTEEHKLASRAAISSCTICKKHFRTSQIFVEHLQSQEHRQKMEKLQEKEGCEALAKLTAMDTDGFSLDEEEEGSEVEEGEERQRNEEDQDCSEKQDGWSSLKEVTLKKMASDEQYDPDTVYGSSFFVPVAGFICRLCNKFYHFESSALHTHCKSLTHFENLKRYRVLYSQKGEAVESSRESLLASDSLRPVTETTTDWSDENALSDDTGLVTNLNSLQPIITLTRLQMQTENQQQEKESEPDPTSQDFTTSSATCTDSTDQDLSLHSKEEETTSQASVAQETPAELPAGSREEPDSEPAAAVEDANEEEEEKEAPAVPGKKNSTGKAKTTPKRRSGRATNRR
ncbi:cip1-interacting zinc finger protein [Seriola lalandi dorsalis]|nr:cip1-interacting zinc finger protein [Seriola lalandi dorsalis]XP_023275323.1 cip1-interacting zinc finger protein [Seriola lalandi dorsalis]